MISLKKVRLVVSVVTSGMLGLVCAASHAGRSVRSDASDSAFNFLGGFWGTDSQQSGVTGVTAGRTQFKLNFNSSGARYYTVCMSEDGFIRFITGDSCSDADFALPPARPYVAVFATDLDSSFSFGGLTYARGFVDTKSTYRLSEAVPAQRFWWSGVSLAGDGGANPFDVQIVLLDRSKGTNNGDFDIEFNYGSGGGDTVPPAGTESNPNAAGFQGFRLGSSSRGPISGPFGPFDTNGGPIRFCFRNGARTSC
jgi:hypothetical protein